MSLNLTFADEIAERINIRAQPKSKILRHLVCNRRLDIQKRQRAERRRGSERPIVRPPSHGTEGHRQTDSDRQGLPEPSPRDSLSSR